MTAGIIKKYAHRGVLFAVVSMIFNQREWLGCFATPFEHGTVRRAAAWYNLSTEQDY